MGDIEGTSNWILFNIEIQGPRCSVICDPWQLVIYFFNGIDVTTRFIKDKVRERYDFIR